MNDDEALLAFIELIDKQSGDYEMQHVDADDFVAKILSDNGFPKLGEAYLMHTAEWWYA